MKTTHLVLLSLIINAPSVWAAPIAQIQKSSGEVWVYSRTERSHPAGPGRAIESGVSIATGANSSAVLHFQDGQLIVLGSSTTFRVKNYSFNAADPSKDQAVFELVQGSLRAVTGRIGDANPGGWRLLTPDATIAINGTDFMAAIERGLYVHVNTGAVTLANAAGTARLLSGKSAFVQAGGAAPVSAVIPDGLFAELDAIALYGSAGSISAGAAGAAQPASIGMASAAIAAGVAAAAIAAAANGGGGTTTHH